MSDLARMTDAERTGFLRANPDYQGEPIEFVTSDTPDPVAPLTAEEERHLRSKLDSDTDGPFGNIDLAEVRRLLATLDAARQSDGAEAGLDTAMRAYFASRGSAIPTITTGRKAIEEAEELVEAIAEGDQLHIREEVADLALVAAVVAAQYGTTVEACIAEKAGRDTGRGEPKQDPRAALQAAPVSIDRERLASAIEAVGQSYMDVKVREWEPGWIASKVSAEYDRLSHAK